MQNQSVDTATAVTVAPGERESASNAATMTFDLDGEARTVPMDYGGTVTVAGDRVDIAIFDTEDPGIRTMTKTASVGDPSRKGFLALVRKGHVEQDKADLFADHARAKGRTWKNPDPGYTAKHGVIDLLAASQPLRKEGARYHPWSESSITEPHGKMLEALRLWERAQEEPELLRQLIAWEHLQTAVSLTGESLAEFMEETNGNASGELAAAIGAVRAFFVAWERDEEREAEANAKYWTEKKHEAAVAAVLSGEKVPHIIPLESDDRRAGTIVYDAFLGGIIFYVRREYSDHDTAFLWKSLRERDADEGTATGEGTTAATE